MSTANFNTTDRGDEEQTGKHVSWRWLLLLVGIVIVLRIVSWILTVVLIPKCENRGLFGDMFGSINSLFSGLAFACFIFAILLQRKELELQRQELKESRVQFKRQADLLEGQAETISTQTFEDTFFRKLRILAEQCTGSAGIGQTPRFLRQSWS